MNKGFVLFILLISLGEVVFGDVKSFAVTTIKPVQTKWQASVKVLAKVKSLSRATIYAPNAGIFWYKQNLNHTKIRKNQNIGHIKVPGQTQRLFVLQDKLKLDKKLLMHIDGLYKTGLATLSQLQIAQNTIEDDTMHIQALQSVLLFNILDAPVSGSLEYLVPMQTKVAKNTPLATIKGSSSVWLSVFVTPSTANNIHVAEQIHWQFEHYAGVGVVKHISDNALNTGLIQVIIKPSKALNLLAGEWVNVAIATKHGFGIRVPLQSVVAYNTKTVVYKLLKHHAVAINVKILFVNAKYAWIKGNLKTTDTIIVKGASSIVPQTPVYSVKSDIL